MRHHMTLQDTIFSLTLFLFLNYPRSPLSSYGFIDTSLSPSTHPLITLYVSLNIYPHLSSLFVDTFPSPPLLLPPNNLKLSLSFSLHPNHPLPLSLFHSLFPPINLSFSPLSPSPFFDTSLRLSLSPLNFVARDENEMQRDQSRSQGRESDIEEEIMKRQKYKHLVELERFNEVFIDSQRYRSRERCINMDKREGGRNKQVV